VTLPDSMRDQPARVRLAQLSVLLAH
jgi:hypothetical protein